MCFLLDKIHILYRRDFMKWLWLKTKLRDWLGVQEAEDYFCRNIDDLERRYSKLVDEHLKLEDTNRALRERNEFILKNFQIAVDHNPYENQSWAVVCINGQPQYVNFLTLRHHEAHEIMRYLRHYDKGSMVVDSPHRTMKLDTFKYF
ncbi:hypothetical protein PQE72_gp157 [Bacillus phage vB_BanS_Skywalker]|uniref:Uncharacterized protein n=2 Tax=Tsamsavirus TaxID=3044849 RepID=A0AAE9CEP6_9CAUD|nr:hypothetical protein PQE72_gp157 [Bacillus phage vB_BanS_Skywalker]YP_010681035.1 hypothetical protein PQE73_gp139 [Bacillus phage vB_BanS_MrDarsey]UGO47971.1 hypothetical protein MRDARSEY_139 [Bacillus phage vB_BanS_MrDarsey]UGO51286.1 hypothetical protein SKYWALKER_129 [Bacillus phage vB_BanS_Skywalker]